jgi:hypothetical protein
MVTCSCLVSTAKPIKAALHGAVQGLPYALGNLKMLFMGSPSQALPDDENDVGDDLSAT